MAEVVQDYLNHRRNGDVDAALALIADGASISSIWGNYYTGTAVVKQFLHDEQAFNNKDHLQVEAPLVEIGENTFMRKYVFKRKIMEYCLPYDWREIYMVKDGQITCNTTMRSHYSFTERAVNLIPNSLNFLPAMPKLF